MLTAEQESCHVTVVYVRALMRMTLLVDGGASGLELAYG